MILDMVDHLRHLLEDRFSLPIPPDRAFRLFTAVGERDWVAGWEPRFPTPTADDATPGTVFETGSTTIWVVVDAAPPERIRYARVTPGDSAGTVEVRLRPTGDGSEVTVAYDLSALSATGDQRLAEFAAGYPAFLRTWQDAITRAI
jgi:hypothetical protein